MVFAAESLLKMITELKHSILLNDFETMNETLQKQAEQYRTQIQQVEPQIQKLNKELNVALYELELEYYLHSNSIPNMNKIPKT